MKAKFDFGENELTSQILYVEFSVYVTHWMENTARHNINVQRS